MKAIKQVLNLLTGKSGATLSPTAALSPAEMDFLFGGKPTVAVSEHSYWWIEDEGLTSPNSDSELPATLT